MNFIRVFAYLFLGLTIFACNPTKRQEIGGDSTESSSIRSATFIYNVSEIILTENTTSARFIPVGDFDSPFFRILPTLPSGMSLNTTTGEISGTPTETLTRTEFLVEVSTLSDTEYAFLNITVNPEPPKSIDYGFTTLQFNKHLTASYTPTLSGGTVTDFDVDPILPNGVFLNNSTGAIEAIVPGTIEPGSTFHTITASNTSGSISTTVLVSIADAPPIGLTYTPGNEEYVIGVTNIANVFTTMTSSFSTTPVPTDVTYSISPKLPAGLTLEDDGSIQGTPTETTVGAANYTITAQNAMGSSSTVITLEVTEPSLSLSYGANPLIVTTEQNNSLTAIPITSYEGGLPVSYSCFVDDDADGIDDRPANDAACPAWVNVDSVTGTISGIPTTLGTIELTIVASNPDNSSAIPETPANPPSTVVRINVIEDSPNDPTNLGYNDNYALIENTPTSITPLNPGGRPNIHILDGVKENETNGGTNTFSTNSGVATFVNPLTGVGAGDTIHYDSNNDGRNDSTLFIREKISDTDYIVFDSINDGDILFGNGNPLTITGTNTATFNSNIDGAIGANNILLYDSDADGTIDTSALITGLTTPNTVFALQAGATNVAAIETWVIHFNSSVGATGPFNHWTIYNSLPSGVTFIDGTFSGTPNLNSNGASSCTTQTGGTFALRIDGRNAIEDGAGNDLTIVDLTGGAGDSFAIFANPINTLTAVNDIIYYDSDNDGTNDSYAQVASVISTTNLRITRLDGTDVATMGLPDQDWNISTISGTQNINLNLSAAPPTRLGYTAARSGSIFKDGVFQLTDGSPIGLGELIKPNSLSGGTPTTYSISPRLPRGLTLDTCNGIISGTPREILPIRNYTITATNSAGSYSETIAISTNNLIAPTTLVYNDTNTSCTDDQATDNDLVFTLFTNQTETPCYQGSAATYSITPELPAGLSLNSLTGEISGTPITTDDTVGNYTVTANNILGTLTTNITLTVDNLPIGTFPTDIAYNYNTTTLGTLTLTERDLINAGELTIGVLNNTGIPTLFGTAAGGVTEVNIAGTDIDTIAAPAAAAPTDGPGGSESSANTRNLVYDPNTGEITTFTYLDTTNNNTLTSNGLLATDAGELSPSAELVTVPVGNGAAVGVQETLSFNLLVNERALNFDYPNNNTITFIPDERAASAGADNTSGAAIHVGGDVANRDASATVTNFCEAELLSSSNTPATATTPNDIDLLNAVANGETVRDGGVAVGSTGLVLDQTACDIRYDGSICASNLTVNGEATGNTTLEYRIKGYNSGSPFPAGFTRNVTINYYDQPNFLFEPDSEFNETKYAINGSYVATANEFEVSKNLNLDGSTIGDSYGPDGPAGSGDTTRCHVGDFQLNLLSDLPTAITFNATNGAFTSTSDVIVGRRNFTLSSTEQNSGLNFSQSETISVQASLVLNNLGQAASKFEAIKADLNNDGIEDVIIRNLQCDDYNGAGGADGVCADDSVPTHIYRHNIATAGLLEGFSSATPNLSTLNASALTPISYGSTKVGIIYARHIGGATDSIHALGITDNEAEDGEALSTTGGFVRGIVQNKTSNSDGFGVVIDGRGLGLMDNEPAAPAGANPAAGQIAIDQFSILANTLNDNGVIATRTEGIVYATTPTVVVRNHSRGGIDLNTGGAIQVVTQNDTNGDGNLDIVIGYKEDTDDDGTGDLTKVCVLLSDGTNFGDTCRPRIDVPNGGDIMAIKFANISNDALDEMFVLSNDGSNSTINVYQNENNSSVGFYTPADLLTLKGNSSFSNFDLEDVNNDSFIDIVATDVFGDVDRDGSPDSLLSGLTVYYNTNLSSDFYTNLVSDEFPTLLHYSHSGGDTNDIEILSFGGEKLILHCQIDRFNASVNLLTGNGTPAPVSAEQTTSCGIIGSF